MVCDGCERTVTRWSPQHEPLLFTSSGMGDDLVEQPRRALFDERLRDVEGATFHEQWAFHTHAWQDDEAISVKMSRQDAMTVSIMSITVDKRHVHTLYAPQPFTAADRDVSLSMPRGAFA